MTTRAVLIVEDDTTLAHAISRNLGARGYAPRGAATVAEALLAIEEEVPALVLLDIDLPDGSGWEVLRRLRASGHEGVPVIVMSALRPSLRLTHEWRCVGVLEKPFPMQSLLRLAAQALGHEAPGETGTEE